MSEFYYRHRHLFEGSEDIPYVRKFAKNYDLLPQLRNSFKFQNNYLRDGLHDYDDGSSRKILSVNAPSILNPNNYHLKNSNPYTDVYVPVNKPIYYGPSVTSILNPAPSRVQHTIISKCEPVVDDDDYNRGRPLLPAAGQRSPRNRDTSNPITYHPIHQVQHTLRGKSLDLRPAAGVSTGITRPGVSDVMNNFDVPMFDAERERMKKQTGYYVPEENMRAAGMKRGYTPHLRSDSPGLRNAGLNVVCNPIYAQRTEEYDLNQGGSRVVYKQTTLLDPNSHPLVRASPGFRMDSEHDVVAGNFRKPDDDHPRRGKGMGNMGLNGPMMQEQSSSIETINIPESRHQPRPKYQWESRSVLEPVHHPEVLHQPEQRYQWEPRNMPEPRHFPEVRNISETRQASEPREAPPAVHEKPRGATPIRETRMVNVKTNTTLNGLPAINIGNIPYDETMGRGRTATRKKSPDRVEVVARGSFPVDTYQIVKRGMKELKAGITMMRDAHSSMAPTRPSTHLQKKLEQLDAMKGHVGLHECLEKRAITALNEERRHRLAGLLKSEKNDIVEHQDLCRKSNAIRASL